MQLSNLSHRLSLEHIERAASVIDPVFLKTPQFVSGALCDTLGTKLTLKVETINPIRCFKGRGADFFMSGLENARPLPQIICASAGNFGQAMAYAGRKRGIKVTVYAAKTANPLKLERMRSLGANVILHSDDFDTAKLEAKRVAQEIGATMIEDGLAPEIAEGAGTIGLELLQLPERLDALIVPLGNGALLTGIARVLKARSPHTRIIAVQAMGAPAMIESWRSGKVIVHEEISTICDGIAVRIPIPEAVEDMHGLVDDALLISDEATIRGMQLLHQHAGLVTEPSGAAGIAAILEQKDLFKDQHVATIICGSNLTPEQMDKWLFPRQ